MNAETRRAVFSLGSNLEDQFQVQEALQGAVDALLEVPDIQFVGVSPVYQTAPIGGPEQPDFFNAVLVLGTGLSASMLLQRAHHVEDAMGRVRQQVWGPRNIDVDLVAVGAEVSDDPALTLPHPRAAERAFVLVPWHDVDPAAELPGHGPVADLLTSVRDQRIQRRSDLLLRPPA